MLGPGTGTLLVHLCPGLAPSTPLAHAPLTLVLSPSCEADPAQQRGQALESLLPSLVLDLLLPSTAVPHFLPHLPLLVFLEKCSVHLLQDLAAAWIYVQGNRP